MCARARTWPYLMARRFRIYTAFVTAVFAREAGHSYHLRLLAHISILVRAELGRLLRYEVAVAMLTNRRGGGR